MTNARSEILARIRAALAETDTPATYMPVSYRSRPTRGHLVERFAERVRGYNAHATKCHANDVTCAIASILPPEARVVLPAALPWDVTGDIDAKFSASQLDEYQAVVTTAALGIAETGTVVLTHGAGQGRRALTLIPDAHVCVVRADQIVEDVPSAVRQLTTEPLQTWISGPSATSDIELERVEGVHGPRTLHVLIVSG